MFREICENLNTIEIAISQVERDLKKYISLEEHQKVNTYTKLYSFLVTCWTEVRVLKLANEYYAFNQDETKRIVNADTLEKKWQIALNIGICKAFGFNDIQQKDTYLADKELLNYTRLSNLIRTQLSSSITIRNKITHGQWIHAFNSRNTAVNFDVTNDLDCENYLLIRLRSNIFECLTRIIHDLCVSKKTYLRDFDKNIKQIDNYFSVYQKQGYEKFKKRMVEKYKKGSNQRANSKKQFVPRKIKISRKLIANTSDPSIVPNYS